MIKKIYFLGLKYVLVFYVYPLVRILLHFYPFKENIMNLNSLF